MHTFRYNHSILGGTFDHFHLGHEHFLSSALADSHHLTLGLVVNSLSPKPYSSQIEPYPVREQTLRQFLKSIHAESRVTIIPLHDVFGTSLTDSSIDAIFVTVETSPNAELINRERVTRALPPLPIITVAHVRGDDGEIISSSRIREGIIDRTGHSYLKFFIQKDVYHLPLSLRATLKNPLGNETTIPPSSLLIAVGDITAQNLTQSDHPPAVSIIDYHSGRRPLTSPLPLPQPTTHLRNPAGTVNSGIAPILSTALSALIDTKTTQVIAIDGEEDLLTLPAILLAPLGSIVAYGLPDQGMCLVLVTPEKKRLAESYLTQFT